MKKKARKEDLHIWRWSDLKPAEKFRVKWAECGYEGSDLTEEYKFHDTRRWRFDFCWPSCRVAVEIDGFGYGHQAQQSMAADNEKANAAVECGWVVLRYNSRQLGSKANAEAAVEQVCRVLEARTSE